MQVANDAPLTGAGSLEAAIESLDFAGDVTVEADNTQTEVCAGTAERIFIKFNI